MGRCRMSQQQAQQNGQRVLAIELAASSDTGFSGNLVLPFGLSLASGAALQIDHAPAQPALPFKTCLPAGCVVPVSFDQATLGKLAKGKLLKVTVNAADNGQPAVLNISLRGFGPALDRITALSH